MQQPSDPAERLALLFSACERGDIEAVRTLAGEVEDIDQGDARGRTCLMVAASRNHTNLVQFLLDFGADPNRRNASGTTPLMFAKTAAFAYGDCRSMKLLIDAGADRDSRDDRGKTALDYTVERAQLVKDFLETYGR